MRLRGSGTARFRTCYGVSAALLHCEANLWISGQFSLHPWPGIALKARIKPIRYSCSNETTDHSASESETRLCDIVGKEWSEL